MKERNMTISLAQARDWFNSGNKQLQELALQVFDRKELTSDFRHIVTFKDACEVLGLRYSFSRTDNIIRTFSRSTSAMFKLNIIRQALNLGYDMQLVKNPSKSYIYCPFNPFITKVEGFRYYKDEINSCNIEIIGEIRTGGVSYYVLNSIAYFHGIDGLGNFNYSTGSGRAITDSGFLGCADADIGFLGCASKEIAQHFGKYFGMLITTAKYADIIKDFEVIESKYII